MTVVQEFLAVTEERERTIGVQRGAGDLPLWVPG
jgi:hypothetical protein